MQQRNTDTDSTGDRLRLPDTEEWQHIGRMDGSDLKVAEGETDIRGWSVRSKEGRVIGVVADLLVDTRHMRVEFIEVATAEDPAHHIVLPIRTAVLDEAAEEVQFPGVSDEGRDSAPLPPPVL